MEQDEEFIVESYPERVSYDGLHEAVLVASEAIDVYI